MQLELKKQKSKNHALLEEIDELKEDHEKLTRKLQEENDRLKAELSGNTQNFQQLLEDNENTKKEQDCSFNFETADPQKFGAIGMERNQKGLHWPKMNGIQFINGIQELETLNGAASQALQGIDLPVVEPPVLVEAKPSGHENCTLNKCSKARKYKNIISKLEHDVTSIVEDRNLLVSELEVLRREHEILGKQAMFNQANIQRERNEIFIQYLDARSKLESLGKHVKCLGDELEKKKRECEEVSSRFFFYFLKYTSIFSSFLKKK
jgi:predicted  nucleic acid-binding Zn-ribbon protein